ncbi:heterokaryon incompatibility protein-domain-containing protein [Xylaria arbuscula]|nr:heterokaryon incompatibility protein-domain-containing protein [Xylaria arbuscula]
MIDHFGLWFTRIISGLSWPFFRLSITAINPLTITASGSFIELEHKPLSTCDYLALSYTWGPATLEEQDAANAQIFTTVQRCYPVNCGGEIILVTRSLRDALKRIQGLMQDPRHRLVWSQTTDNRAIPEFVWVDGICINQDDPQERTEQIKLMTEIYSLASLTVAYLGELGQYEAQTCRGFGLAVQLGNLYQTIKPWVHLLTLNDIRNPGLYALAGAKALSRQDWVEWAIFMSREWFFRTWVLQEATLSGPANTYILCGSLFVLVEAVLLSLNLVFDTNWNVAVFTEVAVASPRDPRCHRYMQRFAGWLAKAHPHQLILKASHRAAKASFFSMSYWQLSLTSCSDPRDKIYGSLGLAAEWEGLDEALLPVDYRLSVSECDQIQLSYSFENHFRLFTLPGVFEFLLEILRLPALASRGDIVESFARVMSCYSGDANWRCLEDGLPQGMAALILWALREDAETYLATAPSTPMVGEDLLFRVERIAALVSEIIKVEPQARKYLPQHDLLTREVTRQKKLRNFPESRNYQETNINHYRALCDSYPNANEVERINREFWGATSPCQFRTLFVTKGGRIGLGPDILQPGDQVWLLAGAKLPFLLRASSSGRMTMVGEAYVDGMMFGELWTEDGFASVTLE